MKKINWKNLSKWLTGGFLIVGVTIPIPLLILNASSGQNQFVLGNYQSYMSADVMDTLNKEYGLDFDYFETVENAKRLLKRNTIDISNTTSYELKTWVAEGLVKKIDWSEFGIQGINNANDALGLFTDTVQKILQPTVDDINLLDYGIPYFLQDLVFVYRGAEIVELDDSSTWEDVLDTMATEPRFEATALPNVIALNDQRTIYSIPRLMQTSNDSINPPSNANIENLTNTYDLLANKINEISTNSISFNSDSNAVLNKMALGEVNGGIMFNGDAIYAASGGDDGIVIEEDDFHCVKPVNTLVALDLLVVNNQINDAKLATTYDVLKQLCLNDGLSDVDEESLSFQNFDYVNYTPTLKSIYDFVLDPDNYFENQSQVNMLEIKDVKQNQIEEPIDDLTKSNFSFAWIALKNKLR